MAVGGGCLGVIGGMSVDGSGTHWGRLPSLFTTKADIRRGRPSYVGVILRNVSMMGDSDISCWCVSLGKLTRSIDDVRNNRSRTQASIVDVLEA